MSITRGDIKTACLVADVKDADELALNNRVGVASVYASCKLR